MESFREKLKNLLNESKDKNNNSKKLEKYFIQSILNTRKKIRQIKEEKSLSFGKIKINTKLINQKQIIFNNYLVNQAKININKVSNSLNKYSFEKIKNAKTPRNLSIILRAVTLIDLHPEKEYNNLTFHKKSKKIKPINIYKHEKLYSNEIKGQFLSEITPFNRQKSSYMNYYCSFRNMEKTETNYDLLNYSNKNKSNFRNSSYKKIDETDDFNRILNNNQKNYEKLRINLDKMKENKENILINKTNNEIKSHFRETDIGKKYKKITDLEINSPYERNNRNFLIKRNQKDNLNLDSFKDLKNNYQYQLKNSFYRNSNC